MYHDQFAWGGTTGGFCPDSSGSDPVWNSVWVQYRTEVRYICIGIHVITSSGVLMHLLCPPFIVNPPPLRISSALSSDGPNASGSTGSTDACNRLEHLVGGAGVCGWVGLAKEIPAKFATSLGRLALVPPWGNRVRFLSGQLSHTRLPPSLTHSLSAPSAQIAAVAKAPVSVVEGVAKEWVPLMLR